MVQFQQPQLKRIVTPMTQTKFTLGEASRETGISKATLSRDIKSGKISADKRPDGSYQIDASELFRVYDRVPQETRETGSTGTLRNDQKPGETPIETGGLQAEVNRLREVLATLNMERERERSQLSDQIEDLRRRLDGETEERRVLTRILTDQRTQPPEPPTAPPADSRGFFGRLFGKTG